MTHIMRIDDFVNESGCDDLNQILKSFVEYVNKNKLDETNWYHITTEPNINKFEIMPKKGFGTNFYGVGVYFTHTPEVIDYYAEQLGRLSYVYIVKFKNTANIVNEYDDNGGKLYLTLMEKYNDDERVSKIMRTKYKIDGITYDNEEDGESIVIFNTNVIQILDKVKLKYDSDYDDYFD